MGVMARVKEIFRSRNVDKEKEKVTRSIQSLALNDIVTFDLEDYIVIGKITYKDSDWEWTVYHLEGERNNRWLSLEEDDEWIIGIYDKSSTPIEEPSSRTLTYEGTEFQLQEHGSAKIKEVEGSVGASVNQTVQYWDMVDKETQEKLLSIEKWGESLEASVGQEITEKEISIIAGT
ncbi:DUF4178 domain-containing protein [Salibacterium salarium]|uniref:DUF4178 domain-containing protein n=1 Tax=Salibacterium salarium TaxID=284579 RepID=A0A428N637_9BACI|nr:DUF4178 domain-containing protein [Salibacterium salarium]RSL33707.1 DUF4178 domain-containing protein [Salibacterium salarium]